MKVTDLRVYKMRDSRLQRMAALVDDIRSEAVDIQEEATCEALTDVRRYANWILCALDRADSELSRKGTA